MRLNCIFSIPMKSLVILMLLPLRLFSQDITGVWIGYIHNDSTNINLYYEVVVSEHKGKPSGYSYTNFIVDGKELTGVKTIRISTRGEKIYFEDAELIYNDYPFEPPRGVKQLSVFELDGTDVMNGKFLTSRTKQYGRSVSGTIFLQRVKLFEASKIYPVLQRMNLLAGLSFIHTEDISKTTAPVITEQPKPPPVSTPAPVIVKPQPPPDIKKELAKRKVETVETVYFSSDSLLLELYDNGYVDGDSVSIIINGKELLTHVRLTEKAVKKTIYITPDMGDSINLVMFAENLGSIAPNSGLAILRDGKTQHRITFTGDLERNAAIILRRKR
jgi:hypothetical protein